MEGESQTSGEAGASGEGATGATGTIAPKMVPESDLLAVKKGLEKQLADNTEAAKGILVEAKTKADTNYQDMLRERASREELEGKLTGLTTKTTELEEKLKNAGDSSELVTKLQNDLLGLKKERLMTEYKLTAEELEGKSIQEIDLLSEAMKLAKAKTTSNYDLGGGQGAGAPLTGNEGLRAAIDAAKSVPK